MGTDVERKAPEGPLLGFRQDFADGSGVLYSLLVLLPKSRGCFDSDIEVAASFSGGPLHLVVTGCPLSCSVRSRGRFANTPIVCWVWQIERSIECWPGDANLC